MSLIIIRGLPGSGKSTLAKLFKNYGWVHYEADMFFEREEGYVFNAADLKAAHDWCFHQVSEHLTYKYDVVVSNTFSRLWEMQRYLDLPYEKQVITCEGNYQNIHGVPNSVIDNMKKRWERY